MQDHNVLARAVREDRVIVTENAEDFRALIGCEEIHPGLIILPCCNRQKSIELINHAVEFLKSVADPMDAMVNHILEVDAEGKISFLELPSSNIPD